MSQLMQTLHNILENAMQNERTFIEADRMYSASYRTDAVVCADEIEENKHEFVDLVCEYLAAKDGKVLADNASESQFEYFWNEMSAYRQQATDLVDSGLIEFVYLVNYKGEGIGYAIKQETKDLQLFISKYNYE